MNLFVVQGIRERGDLNDVIIGTAPFIVTLFVMIGLIVAFPGHRDVAAQFAELNDNGGRYGNETILAATAAALASLTLAAHAQDLPKHHFKVLIQDSPTPHVKLLEAPLWNEWIPAASKGQITADAAPYDQVGIPGRCGAAPSEARRLRLRELRHRQGRGRRSEIRGLRSLRTDADLRRRAQGLRGLARDRGQADAAEMERQAARDRNSAAAGALVRDRGEDLRRSQGQEAARLHQDDGGLHAGHRRRAGQHRVPRGRSRRCRTRWSIAP